MSLSRSLLSASSTASTIRCTTATSFHPAFRIPEIRNFTSSLASRTSSTRKLVTTTAYRPSTLDIPLSPPRNDTVPETSITSPLPRSLQDEPAPLKVSEREAQTSKEQFVEPTPSQTPQPSPSTSTSSPSTTEPTPSTSAPARPRRKLRPRKAAMTLTPTAVFHLKKLLEQPSPRLIRVGVKNRGCSGLAYHLEYVEKPGAFDETVDQDGVQVLIDSKALFSIIGSEMDWVEDKLNQRFVFRNPNIKEQCGCGESFMV